MIVANSTPLINFAAIGRLDILHSLFTTIIIPPAVAHELFEHGRHYPTMSEIEKAAFIVR
jgi:predicted nucleic acid-binding protein